MSRAKRAQGSENQGPGNALRPGDSGQAGGGDDAATGLRLAVRLLIRDLQAIEKDYTSPMDPELGTMVANYARALSQIDRDGRKGSVGEFSGKTNEELLEMARQIPELADLLKSP